MMQRPRPGEGEEDILRMQEEYLQEKNKNRNFQPAAQIVDMRDQQASESTSSKNGACEGHAKRPSKYAQARGLSKLSDKKPHIKNAPGSLMGEICEKNVTELIPAQDSENIIDRDDQVYFPQLIPMVMGNIKEKNVNSVLHLSGPGLEDLTPKGFPAVKKCNPGIVPGTKSIFSQQMDLDTADLNKEPANPMDVDEAKSLNYQSSINLASGFVTLPSKSYIVTSQDAESIHKQNVEILSKMSEKEILEERQKLLACLDPDIINFLKTQRTNPNSTKMDISEVAEQCETSVDLGIKQDDDSFNYDNLSDVDTLWENDILSNPNVDKWINFDSLEKDKLEWMKGIEEHKKHKSEEPYEARFNFKGYLLPFTVEYNETTKTLFHHGDEPHRPGYTLMELFTLARSAIIQQRATALNIIAGILEHYNTGIYTSVIEIPLTKIFFVIRFAMDENKVIVLEPALRAMRNLLYDRVDEACLDALLGMEEGCYQPSLEHDMSEVTELDSKKSELKDYHLADIDLITGALRTDILQRLLYILDTVKPSFNCVQYCLQILTRIVRDSTETSLKIVHSDLLIKCVIENFLPVTGINFHFDASNVYNRKPLLAALKLIRVLALQSNEIAQTLVTKYKVMDPICSYISSEVDGTHGLRIQMEALAILTNLLCNGVALEQALSLTPVLATAMFKHFTGTAIDGNDSVVSITHAAILVQLIIKVLVFEPTNSQHEDFKYKICPIIKQGCCKWINQLCTLNCYSCGHLRLACAIFDCLRILVQLEGVSIAKGFMGECALMGLFSRSNGLKMLLKQLLPSSNLLSSIDSKHLHSSRNLSNLQSCVVDSKHKVLPVLSFLSPIPFFTSLVKLIDSFKDSDTAMQYVNQMRFYLVSINESVPKLCENWFTRSEIEFLFYLLKLTVHTAPYAKSALEETDKNMIFALANKMCYILRSDKKEELNHIFENIVFNKHWCSVERLILSDSNLFTTTLNCIDDIRLCYTKLMNAHERDTGRNILLRRYQEPILPRDWIYLPIVTLYSEHQIIEDNPKQHGLPNDVIKIADKEATVRYCLEWILVNELSSVNLVTDINITDRFCRIMCVFLCDNSLFLEPDIKLLIEKCIKTLFKKEKRCNFNFDRDLIGLHNFQDFYTQFLEQFQSVSYGDHSFAACVLAPLAQKHNIKWRKLIWSEYAGCLRALDCPESKLCYCMDEYLYPEETDVSLIKSYIQALSTKLLRPNTIPFIIAQHHVTCYRKSKLFSTDK